MFVKQRTKWNNGESESCCHSETPAEEARSLK